MTRWPPHLDEAIWLWGRGRRQVPDGLARAAGAPQEAREGFGWPRVRSDRILAVFEAVAAISLCRVPDLDREPLAECRQGGLELRQRRYTCVKGINANDCIGGCMARLKRGRWREPECFICACGDHAWARLSKWHVTLVDLEDAHLLQSYLWSSRGAEGYAHRNSREGGKNRDWYLHRQILSPPEGYQVDHKNRNPADNRKRNLRLCTVKENQANRKQLRSKATSRRGVEAIGKRFRARITVDGRVRHLGMFTTADEAAAAYAAEANKAFGEFMFHSHSR